MGSHKLIVFSLGFALLAVASSGSMEADETECADQMASLASCIPFVSGSAKKPPPQCCAETKKVKESKPKCLCVLIKESSDPSMGLPVNVTLALQMPSLCNIDAKVSDCPSMLNLSPNSPDAKIFKEADSDSATSPPTTSISPKSASMSSTGSSDSSKSDISNPASRTNNGAKSESFDTMSLLALIMGLFIFT